MKVDMKTVVLCFTLFISGHVMGAVGMHLSSPASAQPSQTSLNQLNSTLQQLSARISAVNAALIHLREVQRRR